MIKKRVNATRSAVGVRLSDLGQSKRLWLSLILSFLCAVLVCGVFVMPKFKASAKAPTANDETIGELAFNADGSADANGNVFDSEKLSVLYKAIMGDGYTGNGTLSDVTQLLNLSGSVKTGSGVNTKALNATDFRTNGGKDIYVTLGNVQWEVVYLTTNRNGEIILDLWQATNTAYSRYSGGTGYTNWNYTTYSNLGCIYGTSYMRAYTLGNGGTYYSYTKDQASAGSSGSSQAGQGDYAKFATGNFAGYIDAPANIDYQEKESYVELRGYSGANYNGAFNLPNEAYGTPSVENYYKGGVNSNESDRTNVNTNFTNQASPSINSSGATVSIPANYKTGYENWQNDKVWLPSVTEAVSGGIWGLSSDQRINYTSSDTTLPAYDGIKAQFTWLRSAAYNRSHVAHVLTPTGAMSDSYTSARLGVRPAIHLNLTKAEAASATKLTPPSGTVTSNYTSTALTVNNATTVPGWYKHLIYTDPLALTLSYVKDGSSVPSIIDSGTYTVTVHLVSNKYIWSDNTTSDKTFTYTVNKKPLTINWTTDSNGYEVAQLANTGEIASRDSGSKYPSLVTKYYDASGSPNALVDAPSGLGSWVAVAKLTNEATCNYKVDDTKPFSVAKQQIAYPSLTSGASEVYNGTPQEFTFSDYDSNTMDITMPTGADSFDGNSLWVTNAGSYTVVYTLKNSDLYEWSGTAPTAVTITPKNVSISSDSTNPTDWEKRTATNLKFKVPTALCSGDTKLNLVAVYSLNGGAAQTVPGTIAFDGTDTYTVTIGSGFAKGSYALTVKVADGENYAGSCTYNFEITAQGISLGNTDIVWTINGETYTVSDFDNEYAEVDYTGNPLTVSANFNDASDVAHLEQDGDIEGNWATAVDVGDSYTAVLTVKAIGDYAFSDGPFTLKIKIVPKKLTFANPVWEYNDGTGWNTYSANSKPAYTGNAVEIRISPDYLAGLGLAEGDYTDSYIHANTLTDQGSKSTTATLSITNGNYTTADETGVEYFTFNWEITAQALEYSWTGTQSLTANTATGEKAFEFPAIEFADGQAHSDYFDYVFTVDGTDYTKEDLEQYIGENWNETTAITGTVKAVLKDGVTEVTLKPATGNASSMPFTTGTPKTAITVAITGNGSEYGKVGFTISVTKNNANESARTTVTVYDGTLTELDTFAGNDSALVEYVNGLGAGSYKITVSLNSGDESSYTLVGDYNVEFVIVKQKVELPTLKEVVFSGSTINFKDCIDGFDDKLMKIIGTDDGGIDFGREWRENGYFTTIALLDGDNYEFVKTTINDGGNAPVKYALTDGEATVETLGSEYEYNWMINKFRITKDMWNLKGKNGAKIELPSQFKDLIADPDVLKFTYKYFNDQYGEALEEGSYSFKAGNAYYVSATLTGSDSENFEFENETLTSDKVVYKIEQSKAQEILSNTLGFVKNNLALVIGCAVGLLLLILLIIIIAVVVKKKKKREAELKEEKRLEREERMMRMQMGGGAMPQMPITAAGMIAAQQAQQMQQMQPQVVPQPQPVQQVMPAPVQAQVQQPVQQPAPAVAGNSNGGAVDIAALEERVRRAEERAQKAEKRAARNAEERARAAEERLLRATEERARLAEDQLMRDSYMNRNPVTGAENGNVPLDALGALVLAALKNYAGGEQSEKTAEQPQMLDTGSAAIPPVYLPDAVITTTQTVDTTKKSDDKFARRPKLDESENRSERSDSIDLDGFYDEYNG